MLVRDDPTDGPRMSNRWLPAATWVEALQKTGHIDASLSIDVRKFNTTMSRAPLYGSVMSRFDGSNNIGFFVLATNTNIFFGGNFNITFFSATLQYGTIFDYIHL